MYGIQPRYNEPQYTEFFDITNIIRKPKHKIYFDTTNYNVNTQQKINAEHINSQQIFLILMISQVRKCENSCVPSRQWRTAAGFCSLASTIFCLSFVMHRTQLACSEFDIVTFGLQMLLAKVQILKQKRLNL